VPAIQFPPHPINVTNLQDLLDANWITKAEMCKGVPAGSLQVCS